MSESKRTAGQLLYRPQKHDDWGYLRSSEPDGCGFLHVVATARAGRDISDREMDAHRRAGTDPFGPNALRIMLCWNCHDELVEALRGIDEFAWSSMKADCDEARIEAMRRIDACRTALKKARAEGRS